MIRWIACLTITMLVAGAGLAFGQARDVIKVRSGEHPTFSRLVIEAEDPIQWRIERQENDYDLRISSPMVALDVSGIYRKIPKKRLNAVRALDEDAGITLVVAADHHVKVLELTPEKLVIDVVEGVEDGPLIRTNIAETTELVDADSRKPAVVEPVPPPLQTVLQPPSHHPEPSPASENSAPGSDQVTEWENSPKGAPPNPGLADVRVLEAQDRLLRQLGKAVERGTVEVADQDKLAAWQDAPDPEGEVLPAAPDPQDPLADSDYLSHLNLDARSVYDRAGVALPTDASSPATFADCPAEDMFNIATWAGESPAPEEIALLRRDLVGEFDKVDQEILQKLVKLYIFYGFGTEALALMQSFADEGDQAGHLAEMAEIVEFGHANPGGQIAKLADCPGAAALWAVLARPEIPLGEIPDGDGLHQVFETLPIGLRERVGPVLATRLLRAGFVREARGIANLIARAAGDGGSDFKFLQAKLLLAEEKPEKAFEILAELVENSQPNAAAAAVLWVEELVARDIALSPDLPQELAARAFELKHSELGRALMRAEVLAFAGSGNHKRAFQRVVNALDEGSLDPSQASGLAAEVFQTFKFGPDQASTFPAIYFQYRGLLSEKEMPVGLHEHLALGVLNAGLPDEALILLGSLAEPVSQEAQVLRAKSYIAAGNPTAALEALSGLQSELAQDLRVQALEAMRDYKAALRLVQEGEIVADSQPAKRADIAWRAGDWDEISGEDKPSRNSAAAFMKPTQPDDQVETLEGFQTHMSPPNEVTLSGLKDLIRQSKAARTVLDDLLRDHPTPISE